MAQVPTLLDDFAPLEICASPQNHSKAKQQYSFPKSERFPERAFKSPCAKAFYDIPNDLYKSSRSAGLGKGTKFDFTKTVDKVPGAGEYKIGRELQNRTSSFGQGREAVALNGIIPKKMFRGEAPGPGRYTLSDMKSNIRYSFRKKLKPESTTNMFSPAPNKYNIPEVLNTTGKYFPSKYCSSRAPTISHSDQSRFKSFETNKKNPAPGHYPIVDPMNGEGVYRLTKFKNSMCRSFSKDDRNTLGVNINRKSNQPGPGNYRQPSEFGYYISSEAKNGGNTKSLPKL